MKKATTHISNFGWFGGSLPADSDGYVEYHDHPKYARMTDDQLETLERHRIKAVAAAASVELASRAVAEWRESR